MAAEFDNYRKRIDRERREQSDAAAEGVLLDLLPIVDDLERALQAPAAGRRAGLSRRRRADPSARCSTCCAGAA